MTPDEFEYPHDLEDENLFKLVQLGNDAQHFILSDPMGKYLWARARQDRVDAISEMEALSPLDPQFALKYEAAARKAALPKAFMEWLREAFISASGAERELIGRDSITNDL